MNSDGSQSNWSDNSIPQATMGQTVVISGTAESPATAVASQPTVRQILDLTVGDYGTLEILAASTSSAAGYVFSTHSLDITSKGTVVINTAAPVELGASCTVDGTLTILDNAQSILDNDSISGNGTLNLIGSQLGTVSHPVAVAGNLAVVLQDNATFYASLAGSTGSVTFDTNTLNTLVLDDRGGTVGTAFYGVSDKSLFAISAADGVVPVSTVWNQNPDTASWTVQINSATGTIVTLKDVHTASGFIPGTATFSQDSAGNYILTESNASDSGTIASAAPFTDTTNTAPAGLAANYDNTHIPNTNHFWPATATTADNRADYADSSNWELKTTPWESPANSDNFDTYDKAVVYGVISQANSVQIASFTLSGNADILISAKTSGSGYAFATASTSIYSGCTLTIDTPSGVELGESVQIEGTMKIENNQGNVILDTQGLSGGGTIDVINSTFGSENIPVGLSVSTLNIQQNSTVYFKARSFPDNVIFDNSSNTVVFDGNENTISASFQNVSSKTSFIINNESTLPWNHTPVSAAYSLNDDGSYTLTITRSDGSTLVFSDIQVANDFTPAATADVSQLPDGDWIISTARQDTCFLTGTLIRTNRGDVPVEDLQIGDQVAVLNDEKAFRPIIWTGHRDTSVSTSEYNEEAGYPVCIRANAFGNHEPARNLFVTPEHCLYIDGGFIPARMLVNGTSIFYDRSITHYRYHHFETDRHSIVLAENLPSESYLDTGNRQSFTTGVSPLFVPEKSWNDAVAPLKVAQDQVQPVYERLCERAERLGMGRPVIQATTTDPGLEVFTLSGQRLRCMRHTGDQFLFELPPGIETVTIRSRTSRPCDVVGPFCDDRRTLGVLIGHVKLWDSRESRGIDTHLNADLPGWHPQEHPSLRWTKGSATLPLGYREPTGSGVLCLQIVNGGPYLLASEGQLTQALSA
ncbi:Hint domain-containing protein [Gluconobacter sp. LMG 31484]|uniref:Hint domain-containing protein n=1 Tax=Gluconobacter vitians TaxID=2728102 RepID=A0ABR9Y389_9PROT|nr:Hint domain-containing protein [Gluconobacter vitians]MBF0858408.1 Hint domain-containing protein [Gluconobacter vitians]